MGNILSGLAGLSQGIGSTFGKSYESALDRSQKNALYDELMRAKEAHDRLPPKPLVLPRGPAPMKLRDAVMKNMQALRASQPIKGKVKNITVKDMPVLLPGIRKDIARDLSREDLKLVEGYITGIVR